MRHARIAALAALALAGCSGGTPALTLDQAHEQATELGWTADAQELDDQATDFCENLDDDPAVVEYQMALSMDSGDFDTHVPLYRVMVEYGCPDRTEQLEQIREDTEALT